MANLIRHCSRRGFQIWTPISLRSADKTAGTPTTTGSGSGSGLTEKTLKEHLNGSLNPNDLIKPLHNVGPWDRRFLVWSGQYKKLEDVPSQVGDAALHKAKSWARIRLNIYVLFAMCGGCAFAVYLGKSAGRRGETVEGINLEWHRKINEEHRKEMEAKLKKEESVTAN